MSRPRVLIAQREAENPQDISIIRYHKCLVAEFGFARKWHINIRTYSTLWEFNIAIENGHL